jgi:uncharacterized protein (TIGR02145 family)
MKHILTISLCFLALSLSVYGQTATLGCTTSVACNYNPAATVDDDSCIYYMDCNGVCGGDWIEDECGNCFPPSVEGGSVTFYYTGGVQTFSVPEGVTSATIEALGAQGGGWIVNGAGGYGGYAIGNLSISAGQTLLVYVGSEGGEPYPGWNGGGSGTGTSSDVGGGGGGASDVRVNSGALTDRVIVAGGGGGGGQGDGGVGGGLIGGQGSTLGLATWAQGGTQYAGGSGGLYSLNSCYPGTLASAGSLGIGGDGINGSANCSDYGGSGGGGGYYGGGGMQVNSAAGGSSYIDGLTNASTESGVNSGNGQVVISWVVEPVCILGCLVEQACNYNPEATNDDGTCDFCFCGPGTAWDNLSEQCLIVEGSSDIDGDGCTNLSDLLDLLSDYGICLEPEFAACGDPISHEGYDYSTVLIGEQCWFSENCRYLPAVSPSSEGSETDPYYYVYDYQGTDVEAAKSTSNYDTYGVLYNWPAVMTDEICPTSWHIPSNGEWTQLTDFLGDESVAGDGDALKSTSGWNNDGNGSNSSGFTGLPGGNAYSGSFNDSGNYAQWWSASGFAINDLLFAWLRQLYVAHSNVDVTNAFRSTGYSARCIKD